jgi:SAM-dependent methyltransferase
MPIRSEARQGYESAAAEYERGRPEVPPEALESLRQAVPSEAGATVAELGAGTGKLTRRLATGPRRYIALEPVPAMRARLRAQAPDASVVAGVAERLPFRSHSLDGVVVAQAFHWFRAAEAIPEMHRVLRPRGVVALMWNVRDETVGWVQGITQILDEYDAGSPRYRTRQWETDWKASGLFDPLDRREFSFVHRLDRPAVRARFASVSFIAALPAARRAEALDRIEALLDADPATTGRAEVDLPYRCELYLSHPRE